MKPLPCPWCLSAPRSTRSVQGVTAALGLKVTGIHTEHRDGFAVLHTCGASGPILGDRTAAVRSWNRVVRKASP